jgi:hypothetical protein
MTAFGYISQVEQKTLTVLLILLTGIMFIIAYKLLLKKFSRGTLQREKYAVLYDLEKPYQSGEVEFYFVLEEPKQVAIKIFDQQLQEKLVVKSGDFSADGHIVRFDTNRLPNGIYFYCLETGNQKTMKKMFVVHDKLTE